MKTRPVDIKPIKELGNPAFAIDTPRDHISLGSLVFCVAKKQSGKKNLVEPLVSTETHTNDQSRINRL